MREYRKNSRSLSLVLFFTLAGAVAGGVGAWLLAELSRVNLAPLRKVGDPYPTFTDVAVDATNDLVVVSDESRFSLRTYRRTLLSAEVAEPRTLVSGPRTRLDFACGVDMDPFSRELYVVNNDTGADLLVFDYDDNGEAAPRRTLTPSWRGSWGVSVDRVHDEVAVSIQHINRVAVYHRTASGDDPPLRFIQGPRTRLTDPHGVYLDGKNNEIFVANHDSWHEVPSGKVQQPGDMKGATLDPSTGKFVDFSITVYPREANGDVRPIRHLRGPRTKLNLPMKIHVDTQNDELAVANSGEDSILIFRRTADGNEAPVRQIKGPATGLNNPMGVYIDSENDEIWAANPGDHSLTVYSRTADGDAKPLRSIRGAPVGAPSAGIGNPGGIAYDSIRNQILVPN